MKTLSLLQPWACLVVLGKKRFETRSWATKYRGPLLIHASKKFHSEDQTLMFSEPFWDALGDRADPYGRGIPARDCLPTGKIIGQVDLVDCITTEDWIKQRARDRGRTKHLVQVDAEAGIVTFLTSEDWREYSFGNYSPDRFAWKLENPVEFAEPISARGSLGIWEFDESALGHLAEQAKT